MEKAKKWTDMPEEILNFPGVVLKNYVGGLLDKESLYDWRLVPKDFDSFDQIKFRKLISNLDWPSRSRNYIESDVISGKLKYRCAQIYAHFIFPSENLEKFSDLENIYRIRLKKDAPEAILFSRTLDDSVEPTVVKEYFVDQVVSGDGADTSDQYFITGKHYITDRKYKNLIKNKLLKKLLITEMKESWE